jgi:hypothetical protein
MFKHKETLAQPNDGAYKLIAHLIDKPDTLVRDGSRHGLSVLEQAN